MPLLIVAADRRRGFGDNGRQPMPNRERLRDVARCSLEKVSALRASMKSAVKSRPINVDGAAGHVERDRIDRAGHQALPDRGRLREAGRRETHQDLRRRIPHGWRRRLA